MNDIAKVFLLLWMTFASTCQWWWSKPEPSVDVLLQKLHGFQRCMSGPGVEPGICCTVRGSANRCLLFYDVDADDDVDLRDWREYTNCLSLKAYKYE